jgi:hypothetical protein
MATAETAQVGIGISVNFGPPALPVYEQPICPADGYLWMSGYWAYDDEDGYFWVPVRELRQQTALRRHQVPRAIDKRLNLQAFIFRVG